MFELYQATTSQGSLSEVWIDHKEMLCKKYFKVGGITISGKETKYGYEEITKMYENEIYWSTLIKSDRVLKIYEYGKLQSEEGYYIIQEYVGTDLLHPYCNKTLHNTYPDIIEQIEDMFKLFKRYNLHKLNNSLTNMCGKNGTIKAFDFKYATVRSEESRVKEIYSIDTWVSKIDSTIKDSLINYL
jgi:hypothetical protein